MGVPAYRAHEAGADGEGHASKLIRATRLAVVLFKSDGKSGAAHAAGKETQDHRNGF